MAMKSSFVVANGARAHVLRSDSGAGKPPIVMAHGFSDSAACFASLARVLEPDYDVVAYDARGHGLSEAPESGYDALSLARDMIAIIEALELEDPICLGHSLGGMTVGWLAVLRPELPRAVVIEDALVGGPPRGEIPPEQLKQGKERIAAMFREVTDQPVEQLLRFAQKEYAHWPPEDLQPWAESNAQTRPQAFEAMAQLGFPDLRERLDEIRCPVLILKADADEPTREEHRRQIRALRSGRIVHIDGAGHSVRRDRHPQTVAALREFLATL
jgi:pimeloyl-ACP methyl ester carboxylesterase